MNTLTKEIILPCGIKIKNRILKSAMSENMGGSNFLPTQDFYNLYKSFSEGGTGLCITGNIMIDSDHLGENNNVVLSEKNFDIDKFKAWSESKSDMSLWAQLNHPGKQSPKFLNKKPVAPSAITFANKSLNKLFNSPRELEDHEIEEIIKKFGISARLAKESGFDGVQIHGAHGYLVGQFLSPLHNQRTDRWGGSLENRLRFVVRVYEEIRQSVGPKYPIGIKLNSADFQRGGFTHQEAIIVAKKLSELGIDLIEISGGSYESPAMTGDIKKSTIDREAYFLKYAKDIKDNIKCPLVVTGGFRSANIMIDAIEKKETDMIGLARPIAINPNFPNELLSNINAVSKVKKISTNISFIDKTFPLEIIWYTNQLQRLGKGLNSNPEISAWRPIYNMIKELGLNSIKKVRN